MMNLARLASRLSFNRGLALPIAVVLCFLLVNAFFAHHLFNSLTAGDANSRIESTAHAPTKHRLEGAFVSVLLLTFNNSKILDNILHALLHQPSPIKVEIIVFDNGCFESTTRIIAKHQTLASAPSSSGSTYQLEYLPLCTNMQYSKAYNLASTHASASSEWFLLLNDDVIPRGSFFHNFHLTLLSLRSTGGHSEVGAIGCKLLFPNQHIVEAGSLIRADGSTDNFLRCIHHFARCSLYTLCALLGLDCFHRLVWIVVDNTVMM
jgi:hypothetical protein